MKDLRAELAEILDRLKARPVDSNVDSGLQLLKAFLRIRDVAMRAALVDLVESLARNPSARQH